MTALPSSRPSPLAPLVASERAGRTLDELLRSGHDEPYRRMVEAIGDYAIFFLTPEGTIASWNAGAQRIKGYARQEILGRHFSVFYTPEALAANWPQEELRRAALDGRLEDEGWRLRKDGSRFWANVVITAFRDKDERLLGFIKVTRDLSERRQQEQRLRDSERTLRQLVTSVVDYAIYSMDPSGLITTWNIGAQRIKGYSAQEVIGNNFSMFYLPEDRQRGAPQAALVRAAELGHFESEGWRVRKDGTRLWASVTISPIRGEGGELLGFSKVTRDLTERRKALEDLREREESLRLLVEGVKDHAMFLMDARGRIRTWNSGAQEVFGISAQEALGRDVSILDVEDAAEGSSMSELTAAEVGFHRFEGWKRRGDGARFWAEITITHLKDAEGVSRGYVEIVRDLTERQRVQTLELEGRRVADFIAMLSHELRNPLGPVRNAASILQRLAQRQEAVWCVEVIQRQVALMSRLVDDLLDVSRITRGKLRLELVPLDLGHLLSTAIESMKPNLEARRHSLTAQLDAEPVFVNGDATRLTQVVLNLLNNAAKYTPSGGQITVRLERHDSTAVVQVQDNGIGMASTLVDHVFDPFVQGARGLDRSEGGLGIGLTLVRSIVQLHRGSVVAASPGAGQGSTFTMRLPLLGTAIEPSSAPKIREAVNKQKILVVDDNHDSAESLSLLLQMHGHDVRVAYDGSDALALAATFHPDKVLLDIGLPDMDGYEVGRRLRELPGLADVQLIAVTGYGQDADRQAAIAAGFASHLTKPVDLQELSRLMM
jgi:PAS domain S-box-containing protein